MTPPLDGIAPVGPSEAHTPGSSRGFREGGTSERRTSERDLKRMCSKEFEPDSAAHGYQQRTVKRGCQECCRRIATNNYFQALTLAFTVFALWGEDIKMVAFSRSADETFDVLTMLAIAIFSFEIFVASIGKPDYFNSFFFYLDFIATVSLVIDLSFVAEKLFYQQNTDDDGGQATAETSNVARAGRASRAGTRAGRITRVIRVVRLIRIVKLYKQIVEQKEKDKHHASSSFLQVTPGDGGLEDAEEEEIDNEGKGHDDEEHQQLDDESRVGKKLSDLTTRRVIVMVLVMLLCIPQLQSDQHVDTYPSGATYSVKFLEDRWAEFQLQGFNCNTTRHNLLEATDDPINEICARDQGCACKVAHLRQDYEKALFLLLQMTTKPVDDSYEYEFTSHLFYMNLWTPLKPSALTCIANACNWQYLDWQQTLDRKTADNLRDKHALRNGIPLDIEIYHPDMLRLSEMHLEGIFVREEWLVHLGPDAADKEKGFGLLMFFDQRRYTRAEAVCSIFMTIFICGVLLVGAMSFSRDANELVLHPIKRLIQKMEMIREDPMAAMRFGKEDDKKRLEEHDEDLQAKGGCWGLFECCRRRKARAVEPMETQILERTILKIGKLLALGFGEAGAAIIGQNMKGSDSTSVNPMIAGKKMEAIFGFCDIRNFTDATEILQDGVMNYVNQIAEIVHSVTSEFSGSANKNIGDAFLLVWKLSGIEHSPYYQMQMQNMPAISKQVAKLIYEDGSEIELALQKSASFNSSGGNRGGSSLLSPSTSMTGRNFATSAPPQPKLPSRTGSLLSIPKTGSLLSLPKSGSSNQLSQVSQRIFDMATNHSSSLRTVRAKMADLAIMSFLKIIAEVNKSYVLAEYRTHEALNKRMPDFRVKMGFGLHVGWAIEGAIGSEFKIDASYLSPNVNMAARLEAATKQYGVPLLISGEMINVCSPLFVRYCRQIDRVTVKGSVEPMGLYTVDLDPENLPVNEPPAEGDQAGGARLTESKTADASRMMVRRGSNSRRPKTPKQKEAMLREQRKVKMWQPQFQVYSMFLHDPDLLCMREDVTQDFTELFRQAYMNYQAGEWLTARDLLRRTIFLRHKHEEDGPSRTLLSFIRVYNFKAPDDWFGYRELTEK